jgi:hypothetical protein
MPLAYEKVYSYDLWENFLSKYLFCKFRIKREVLILKIRASRHGY